MASLSPLTVALKLVLVCGSVALLAQAGNEPRVPPIPSVEQFVQGTGLRIRLTMRTTSLDALTDPGFTAVFENIGAGIIHINPRVVPNLRIYDADGAFVRPGLVIICECQGSRLNKEDLIPIPPGQSWTLPMPPEHPRYRYRDEMASYSAALNGIQGVGLPTGRYTARFTYVSFPRGLDPLAHYDVRELPDVWEGRQDAEPVSFSVGPGAESVVRSPAAWYERNGASSEIPGRLASGDSEDFDAALSLVRATRWKAAVPGLMALLGSETPRKRRVAVSALLNLGVEGLYDRMRSLVDDPDRSVAEAALEYLLVRECNVKDLPLLERRYGPMDNIAVAYFSCGDASTFSKLRSFLTSDPKSRWASVALSRLTFRPGDPEEIPTITAAEWDAWYEKHRRESREQWAVAAVREPERKGSFHAPAFDYLRRQNNREWLEDFRRGAASEWYATRIAAARGVAQFERAEGIALLRRELNHRSGDAFSRAVDALNAVTGQYLDFDFTFPLERQRALEAYSSSR